MPGYIKLHRELLSKSIWLNSTSQQKSILIAVLLSVNFVEKEWEWKGEKFKVSPGQMITSLESIRVKSGKGVSIQNVRTSLVRFEKLQFLTNESTKTGRLITIVNWGTYQFKSDDINILSNKDLTKSQQRPNKDLTPKKKVNKVNKVKKVKKSIGKFSPPTQDDVSNYFLDNGFTKQSGSKAWNYYDVADWKDSRGNQVKNWKQKMRGVWFKDENKINNVQVINNRNLTRSERNALECQRFIEEKENEIT